MPGERKRPISHVYKRGLLIQATKQVMRTEGLAACTVRRVASATGYSSGTIHYYFDDMNELVDVAYLELTSDYVGAIRNTDAAEPVAAFWETLRRYLTPFVEHPGAATLWFDFAAARSVGEHAETLSASIGMVRDLLASRLVAAAPGAEGREGPLVALLLGQLLLFRAGEVDLESLKQAVVAISGIAPPDSFRLDAPCAICRLNQRPEKVAQIVWR